MRIVEKISDMRAIIRNQKEAKKSIGLVPTMGYLHEGHISLVKASKEDNDFNIVSIFVNPIQFGVNEDFGNYPRDLGRDSIIAEKAGVDVIFAPDVKEMYPGGFSTHVEVEGITDILCGSSRPGHFKGVTTVVSKLFNIVEPDKAYFGQKDYQQAAVIKRMVKDLNVNLEVITCPIIREPDGLAMSSRNSYLNSEERKAAVILYKSLNEAQNLVKSGLRDSHTLKGNILVYLGKETMAAVEYVEVLDTESLKLVENINGRVLVALAVKIGSTRLIDNMVIEV